MLESTNEELHFSFPNVHAHAEARIQFHRTLRIPDDGTDYPLPAGLGNFPLYHVDDFAAKLPTEWSKRGGIFLPMYQCEALWIGFHSSYPMALKVAAGKVDAVSGEPWCESIGDDPQNYVVLSSQPWLDGFNVGDGVVRQFVAMPLGQGFTAEEQLTGEANFGGIQFWVCPMQPDIYEERVLKPRLEAEARRREEFRQGRQMLYSIDMGLAPGGRVRQQINVDGFGLDVWEQSQSLRCFVHLINSEQFSKVTGFPTPPSPITPLEYAARGIPWFDYYAENECDLAASKQLAGLSSVTAMKMKSGTQPLPDNEEIATYLKRYPTQLRRRVDQFKF